MGSAQRPTSGTRAAPGFIVGAPIGRKLESARTRAIAQLPVNKAGKICAYVGLEHEAYSCVHADQAFDDAATDVVAPDFWADLRPDEFGNQKIFELLSGGVVAGSTVSPRRSVQ